MTMVNCWYAQGQKCLIVTMVNCWSAQGQCCLIVTMVNCWVCSRSMLSYSDNGKLLGLLEVKVFL